MKLLMLTKFVPLPADSGGKQRSLAVLRRLLEAGDVTLCAFNDGHGDIEGLRRMGVAVRTVPRLGSASAAIGALRARSLSAGRFSSPALLAHARAAADEHRPDALLVSYGQLAPYGPAIPARHRILDLHNVESTLYGSYARSATSASRRLAARVEEAAMRRIERRACTAYDTVSVVSDVDADRLPVRPARLLVCPNGIDVVDPLPPSDEAAVAFVGLLGWTPNADAARWLAGEVWPQVRDRVPGARLLLVGRDPGEDVRALAGPDIEVTGTVESVTPYLRRCRVAVAPLLAGGGSRLKILEALNASRPVVATTVGAEGLGDLVGRGLALADGPNPFADALVQLLGDPNAAAAAGAAGHDAVAERYSWERTLAPLGAVLDELS